MLCSSMGAYILLTVYIFEDSIATPKGIFGFALILQRMFFMLFHKMKYVLTSLLLILSFNAFSNEYVNYSTEVSWDGPYEKAHYCRGFFTGIHSADRNSLCVEDSWWYASAFSSVYEKLVYDTSINVSGGNYTSRNGMHTCPSGWAIVAIGVEPKDLFGLDLAMGWRFNNTFWCKSFTSGPVDIIVSGGAGREHRQGMHACPVGYFMSGWKENENKLECSKVADDDSDSGTGGGGGSCNSMHCYIER